MLTEPVHERTRRYTSDEWETIKPRVEQLYVKDRHTLRQLMVILKEKYGFSASEKQLKSRITKWGFDVKNVKGDIMIQMARTKAKRKRLEGKDSAFRVNKAPVNERKMTRYLTRNEVSEEELLYMASPIDAPSPAFSVFTPRPPSPFHHDPQPDSSDHNDATVPNTSLSLTARSDSMASDEIELLKVLVSLPSQQLAQHSDGMFSRSSSMAPEPTGRGQEISLRAGLPNPYREIRIDPREPETLMMRFLEQTCSILSISEGRDENPWRSLLFPLARDSPALYHAIAAMAAFHISRERPSFRFDGLQHQQLSMRSLVTKLQRLDDLHTETTLATMLVLAFTEKWDQHISTGSRHLRAADILFRRVVWWNIDGKPLGVNTALLTFLYNTWYYLDILARLVTMGPPPGVRFPIRQKLDSFMGCATTLFPLIGQVADLCYKVRRTPTNSASIISQATFLQDKIQNWSPGDRSYSDIQDDSNNGQHILHTIQTAKAHRYATLLYLHQAVPEIPSPSSEVLAKTILKFLATVPPPSQAIIVQIYPLFVAGCEVEQEEDRQWVRERWAFMAARMWVGNVDRCWEITQEVWSRRNAANACRKAKLGAQSDQYQLLNTQQTENSMEMEKMDPELTIRGKLHWAGVMRDWEWEVSF